MRVIFLLLCFAGIFAVSCTPQKAVTNNYLQYTSDTSGIQILDSAVSRIRKGDLLYIRVYSNASGLTPQADAPYNLPESAAGGGGGSTSGFLVDQEGNIEYPQLGLLHVEGLSRDQLALLIKDRLKGQLNSPTVMVRFLNYRVTILGEVNQPNTFNVPYEQITILEAMGLAGDVTEFGRKDNVKVIREVNGQREVGLIDLTSKDMFHSPYFRLRQNDVVLVEQTRRKFK